MRREEKGRVHLRKYSATLVFQQKTLWQRDAQKSLLHEQKKVTEISAKKKQIKTLPLAKKAGHLKVSHERCKD